MQNEVKFLHLLLITYLGCGAFLFEHLAKNNCPPVNNNNGSLLNSANDKSISDLRLESAQRMWNITNQLNILYESNWTKLILAELESFEEKLKKSRTEVEDGGNNLLVVADLADNLSDLDPDRDSKASNKDSNDNDRSSKKSSSDNNENNEDRRKTYKQKEKSRFKSIRKWFLHALATISGMGK